VEAFGDHCLDIPYMSLADLLEMHRRRDASKTAIVDISHGSQINFGQLDQIVTDIAVFLKSCGISKGSRILVLSRPRLEVLLIWLGVWRMGAIICPFEIEINAKQMESLVATLDPSLILHHKDVNLEGLIPPRCMANCVRFGNWFTVDLEDEFFQSLPSGSNKLDVSERNDPADIAACVCTSGTTGRPKIVVFNHAAYWMNGLDTIDFFGITEDDNTLEYRSFGWVSSQVASLMPFLLKGPTMHIAKRFSHSRFFEWIINYGITFSVGVPTVLNMLLNRPVVHARGQTTLQRMSCSTAPLTEQQWKQFEEMYGINILQFYGVSETGVVCGNRHYRRKLGTIGYPSLHQEVRIIDHDGRECAVNTEGEITIGGPKLAIGYLLDDGSIDPLLRNRIGTGDLGIRDFDGFVRITGRTKDLIISGGSKIAPLEIEEIIMRHSEVSEVAALGVPDEIYGEVIVCYAVAKSYRLSEATLIEHCTVHLPPAKRPKQIYIVPELPRSDRGKVLRDKLRNEWNKANQIIR
jgi:long-chain acyl-CoA synthetase